MPTHRKQKLELTWIGKEHRPKLEPRILLEDPEKSYHAPHRVTDDDIFDNRLIFGDNLLALKALEQEFTGKIKCIYIDPPFNTQQAMEYYTDGLEHSTWLSLMRERIILLHRLLSPDGSMFIHIDDNELGYLIAIVDEIFGRANRISIITFKQSSASGPKSINPGIVTTSNFILYYTKDKSMWQPNKVFIGTKRDNRYNKCIINYDDTFSNWKLERLREAVAKKYDIKASQLKENFGDDLENVIEEFVLSEPWRIVRTARVAPKDINEGARQVLQKSKEVQDKVFKSVRDNNSDYYFVNGEQLIFYSSKAKEINGRFVTGEPLSTIWDDLLSNNLHKEGGVTFPKGKKPELLIKRILELSTNINDWVLDSFAGSGTTGAVAHKMNRKWIMIEQGDHCHTHIEPRMKRVISGEDQDGSSKPVSWKGGGGFRYFQLAPSLLEKDKWSNWVINRDYNSAMLAEAACKLEGFIYAPSNTVYWQHGHSTEHDFIYVTTQHLRHDQLQQLSEEVGEQRSLLVMCAAFRAQIDQFPNLTVKKLPKAVLNRCEWGCDDYSLQVENLPQAPPKPGQLELIRE